MVEENYSGLEEKREQLFSDMKKEFKNNALMAAAIPVCSLQLVYLFHLTQHSVKWTDFLPPSQKSENIANNRRKLRVICDLQPLSIWFFSGGSCLQLSTRRK